jgi:hypothetical protein
LDGITVLWLGLPDSALHAHGDDLREALEPVLADADAYLAPWPADPHPDHRAVGIAAAAAAPVSTHGWSYPIWTWAWVDPADPSVPWERARVVPLDEEARTARRRAVRCFASQVEPGPDGSRPVLAARLLDHVDRDTDLIFREPRVESAPIERFAALYAEGKDPWDADSWYERRKRSVVLASLPRDRYRAAFEPTWGPGRRLCRRRRVSGRRARRGPRRVEATRRGRIPARVSHHRARAYERQAAWPGSRRPCRFVAVVGFGWGYAGPSTSSCRDCR